MNRRASSSELKTPGSQSRFYYGWVVLGASFMMTLMSQGIQGSFGNFVKPMSAEFGWDRATAVLPMTVAILVSGLFQPMVGRLVDLYEPKRIITIGIVILGLSIASIAWTPGIWYFTIVYGVVFAMAVSTAGNIPNSTLNARWFVRLRGRAMATVVAGGSVGQLLVIPASMLLLIQTDWRSTYLILGAFTVLVGFPLAFFILRNHPQEMGLLPDGDATLDASNGQGEGQEEAPPTPTAPLEPDKWHGALASTQMWLLAGSFFVCGFSVFLVQTHFVALVTDRGITPTVAATALGLLSGFNLVGTLSAGVISDRIGRKNPLALIYCVRGLAIAFLLVADTPWMLYVFAAVAGLSWFSSVPLTIALTSEIYGIRHMGTLMGVVFLSHQAGGAISTYVAGRMFDLSGSYNGIFICTIVLLLAAGLASYLIRERQYSLKYQAVAST